MIIARCASTLHKEGPEDRAEIGRKLAIVAGPSPEGLPETGWNQKLES